MTTIQACFSTGALMATLFYYLFEDWWATTFYSILIPAILTLILMLIFL